MWDSTDLDATSADLDPTPRNPRISLKLTEIDLQKSPIGFDHLPPTLRANQQSAALLHSTAESPRIPHRARVSNGLGSGLVN